MFQDEPIVLNRKKKFGSRKASDFNNDFEFGERDAMSNEDDWVMSDVMKQLKNKVEPEAEPLVEIFRLFHFISRKYEKHLSNEEAAVLCLGSDCPTPANQLVLWGAYPLHWADSVCRFGHPCCPISPPVCNMSLTPIVSFKHI